MWPQVSVKVCVAAAYENDAGQERSSKSWTANLFDFMESRFMVRVSSRLGVAWATMTLRIGALAGQKVRGNHVDRRGYGKLSQKTGL